MTLFVGTSGWQYRDWRGPFYPPRLAAREWLVHYAKQFATVEVNNTFYRLPERATFEGWARATPDDFVIATKASRFLTHIKRLRDPAEPVARLLDRTAGLGAKTGPILLQLPPDFPLALDRLADTLEQFPSSMRVAVEPRHESWFVDECFELLAARDAALCIVDRRNRNSPLTRTASWGYVRFHEGVATPRPCYGERALNTWVERIAKRWTADADVFVYFNNDQRACAVRDATRFARLAARAGLKPTRVPATVPVPVGRG